jgi:hypothetical protein
MNKLIKFLGVFLLAFVSIPAYANIIQMQAVMKCKSRSGETFLKPYANGTVNIATTGRFLQTDDNGHFYLINYRDKYIQLYLANDHTIIVDCRSRLTLVKNGSVILGERGSSCPCS